LRHFCTLFNALYQHHALALFSSLEANAVDFKLYCFCMDEESYQFISSKKEEKLIAIAIESLLEEMPELREAKKNRSLVEFFFTCSSGICKYLFKKFSFISELVYLDSDLYFFDSPEKIFKEIGAASISIVPHRFEGINRLRNIYGYYNVGWVSFRRDSEGMACLDEWYSNCIAWCYDKLESNKYADQKYLDNWNVNYKNVFIIKNKGVNAAPWNIGNYKVTLKNEKLFIDDSPLVFYHYASLKCLGEAYYTTCSSYFTSLKPIVKEKIYRHYIRKLQSSGYEPKVNLRQKKTLFHNIVRSTIRIIYKDFISKKFIKEGYRQKILLIVHLPPPIHGASLINKLIQDSTFFNSRFETKYINLSTSKQILEIGKFNLYKIITAITIQMRVLFNLSMRSYDLCYVTMTSKSIGFLKDIMIIFWLKLFNKKVVYHINNRGVALYQNRKLYNYLYQFAFRNVKVILTSPLLSSDVEKYIKKEQLFFCPNAIKPLTNYTINFNHTDNKNPKLLFLSNMMAEKGVYELLEACYILKTAGWLFECNFVGSWSDVSKGDFDNKVKGYGLEKVAIGHGPKYDAEKFKFLEISDIFILPTYYPIECFPLSILEAMQFGIPVISTKHAAIPEIVESGETGLLVPIKDSKSLAKNIEWLLKEKLLRKKMGQKGRRKFEEEYTIEKFEEKLSQILIQICTN
jgi:glycosyltransferase involved in cell wall biosynthesis